MRRGRAQYSVEFLITYGWALLILGIVVGTIYTFGWLDPGNFLPQKCHFYGQVGCKDYYLDEDQFMLSLVNNFGVNLYIKDIELIVNGVEVTVEGNWSDSELNDKLWNRSDSIQIAIDLNTTVSSKLVVVGDRVDGIAIIRYFSNRTCEGCYVDEIGVGSCDSACVHSATGRVLVKVSD